MRPTDIMDKETIDYLLYLEKEKPNFIYFDADTTNWWYSKDLATVKDLGVVGELSGGISLKNFSLWLANGPKTFVPTKTQFEALSNVKVNLPFEEYSQPYPSIMIDLRSFVCSQEQGWMSVLCNWEANKYLCLSLLIRRNNKSYLISNTTNSKIDGGMEEALLRMDSKLEGDGSAVTIFRASCNACLALSHYGCHADYLFPKEVDRDRGLANENSERGTRARKRLKLSPKAISLDKTVILHRSEKRKASDPEHSGSEKGFHWRSGHWTMQPYGPNNSLRKRLLRRPVMIRADLLTVDASQISTTYYTDT